MRYQDTTSLAAGLDTLVLNYYGSLFSHWSQQLPLLKNRAQNESVRCEIGKTEFAVMPHSGGRMFAYLLKSPELDLKITAGSSEKSVTIQAYLHSTFLWKFGSGLCWQNSVEICRKIIREFVDFTKEEISRVDIASDFFMPKNKAFKLADIENFVSQSFWKGTYSPKEETSPTIKHADHSAWYMFGNNFTGFTFGKGKTIQGRVYNKSLELKNTDKEDLFLQIWELDKNLNEGQVWRVEFQLRKEALNSLDITTIKDLQNASSGLWHYLTKNWLSLRAPSKAKQRTRWPVDPKWNTVIDAARLFSGERPVKVIKRSQATEKALIRQIAGCITSLGAIANKGEQKEEVKGLETMIQYLLLRLQLELSSEKYKEKVKEKSYLYQ